MGTRTAESESKDLEEDHKYFELTTCEPYGKRSIIIFCRDRETGERVRIDVNDFEPYFYANIEESDLAFELLERNNSAVIDVSAGYESIEGEKLVKLTLARPGATREVREKFDRTWESDINYTMRFKIDVGIKDVFKIHESLLNKEGVNHYEVSWAFIEPVEDLDPKVDKKNFYFDIEVDNKKGHSDPYGEDTDMQPVVMITALDNYDEELVTWTWRDDFDTQKTKDEIYSEPDEKDLEWEKRFFDSEVKMLANFCEYFKSNNYDIISGWYSDKYDVPYLINRMADLGLSPKSWSPLGNVNDGSSKWSQAKVSGIFMNDLKRRYAKIEDPKSEGLLAVASDEIDMAWEQESPKIHKLWRNDIEPLFEYNAKDVIATKGVDDEIGVTDFYIQKMYRTGTRVEDIEKASKVIDYYHLYLADDDEILPRKNQGSHKDFGGAVVFDPSKTGVVGPIAVLDLSKIYPSIMITLQLAYENFVDRDIIQLNEEITIQDARLDENNNEQKFERTLEMGTIVDPGEDLYKLGRKNLFDKIYDLDQEGNLEKSVDWEFIEGTEEGTRLPNGVRVDMENDSLTIRVLDEMFELRYYYEDQIENLDTSDPNYKSKYDRLYKMRQVEKDNINAVYGVMGYSKFRLFRPEMSESVTFVGRHLLQMCREVVEGKMGYEILYGDTDSIMIDVSSETDDVDEAVEIGHEIGKTVNESMNDFAENFCDVGRDDHMFEIEFEKLFERMFFGDKKKRYAGLKVWDEDGGMLEKPYTDITGFEYQRSESPPVTAKLQKDMFDKILIEAADKDDIVSVVERYYLDVKDGKVPAKDCCRSPSLGGWDKQGAHATAAKYTRRFFDDVDINTGDSIYIVYVKQDQVGFNHNGKKLQRTDKIGMVDDMEPPMAKCQCKNCGNEWEENEFVRPIQLKHECPSCGHSKEDSDGDPFHVQGCRVDWETIAHKVIKKKARKVFRHLGIESKIESLGRQATFGQY